MLDALRNALIISLVLAIFYPGEHVTLDTEAYGVQLGCVLLQEKSNDTVQPIGFWSRSSDTGRRCDTTKRESPTFVWSMHFLCLNLEVTRFNIRTEHSLLSWILNWNDSVEHFVRRLQRQSEFEFDVVHRAGVKGRAADALSSLSTTGADTLTLWNDLLSWAVEASNTKIPTVYFIDADECATSKGTTTRVFMAAHGWKSATTDHQFIKAPNVYRSNDARRQR